MKLVFHTISCFTTVVVALLVWSMVLSDRERDSLTTIADRLDSMIGEDGFYVRTQDVGVDEWGNDRWVKYHRESDGDLHEMVAVWSAGPDGEPDTRDDMKETRHNFNAQGLGRDLGRGLVDGARDRLFGDDEQDDQQ